jgi:hypothetical protein
MIVKWVTKNSLIVFCHINPLLLKLFPLVFEHFLEISHLNNSRIDSILGIVNDLNILSSVLRQ